MGRKWVLLTGTLLLAAALCLTGYNLWEDHRAGENTLRVVAEMQRTAEESPPAPPPEHTAPGEGPLETEVPEDEPLPTGEMPVREVDGHAYIGTLEFPALELSLPVMAGWSYPDLKLAPCRYAGSVYSDDMVVAGHNYRTHFGRLSRLQTGDEVSFADVDGNKFSYTVESLEQLPPTAVEEMNSGEWDLTLFTCTLGGKARLAVRCTKSDA